MCVLCRYFVVAGATNSFGFLLFRRPWLPSGEKITSESLPLINHMSYFFLLFFISIYSQAFWHATGWKSAIIWLTYIVFGTDGSDHRVHRTININRDVHGKVIYCQMSSLPESRSKIPGSKHRRRYVFTTRQNAFIKSCKNDWNCTSCV